MYSNLVFQGGGAKAIAYCGAIEALEQKGIINFVKNIIGSSAGSIIATLLSVGYDSKEMKEIMKNTSLDSFKGDEYWFVGSIYRLWYGNGVYDSTKLYDWMGDLLKDKTGEEDLTFQDIYEYYGINLVITSTCIDLQKEFYFNHNDYPTMPVRLAIKMSTAIPFYFEAVQHDGHYFVDGGTLDNYPVNYFPDKDNTLGFKLINTEENVIAESIGNVSEGVHIVESFLKQIDRLTMELDSTNNSVLINTFDVKTTDFNLTDDIKIKLIEEGYKATHNFLKDIQYI